MLKTPAMDSVRGSMLPVFVAAFIAETIELILVIYSVDFKSNFYFIIK